MEDEYSFAKEIKTEISPIDDTESGILTEESRLSVKNELLDDEEQTSKKGLDSYQLKVDNHEEYIKFEVCDEKLPYDQLKEEIENSSKAGPSDCDNLDIGAHCSVKQEYDCDFNEEVEIKNDPDFEGMITSENSSQSGSDDEDSIQSEEGMEDGFYKLESEDVDEENLDELVRLRRSGRRNDRNAEKQGTGLKASSNTHKNRIQVKKLRKELYKCNDCDFSTPWSSDLCNHRKIRHSNRIIAEFKCNSCEFSTKYKHNLKNHINCVHLKLKAFKCHLCDYETGQASSFKVHIDSVHCGEKRKCNECDFSTIWPSSMYSHRKIKHPNETVRDIKCNLCDFITKYKCHLKTHLNAVHLKNKKFKCDDCDFSTAYSHSLDKHRTIRHSSETATYVKCDLCNFTAKYESHLKAHINSVHLKNKKFKCDDCDFSTAYRYSLHKHRKIRHPSEIVTDIKCDSCDFIAKNSFHLKGHNRKVHLKKKEYKCDDCDYSTQWIHAFRMHKDIKHSNGNAAEFKCNFCDFSTKYKWSFKTHINSLHTSQEFTCEDCEFSTGQASYLDRHRKLKHPNEIATEFNCNFCDFITKFKYNLKHHLNNVHSSQRFKCDVCDFSTGQASHLHKHRKSKHPKEVVE